MWPLPVACLLPQLKVNIVGAAAAGQLQVKPTAEVKIDAVARLRSD